MIRNYGNRSQFFEINKTSDLPLDTISQVEWIDDMYFATSSWDGSFRVY